MTIDRRLYNARTEHVGFAPIKQGHGGAGAVGYSFVACLSRLTIDHASLSRRGIQGGGGVIVPCIAIVGRTAAPRVPTIRTKDVGFSPSIRQTSCACTEDGIYLSLLQ